MVPENAMFIRVFGIGFMDYWDMKPEGEGRESGWRLGGEKGGKGEGEGEDSGRFSGLVGRATGKNYNL